KTKARTPKEKAHNISGAEVIRLNFKNPLGTDPSGFFVLLFSRRISNVGAALISRNANFWSEISIASK
ncbi:MAG TPA: hypothetical protein VK460_04960, partial [Burkholderiales bacterium]|nr:hypothetical protein [Burkholderiales bacterium]